MMMDSRTEGVADPVNPVEQIIYPGTGQIPGCQGKWGAEMTIRDFPG